ncbi:unnamed protein product [Mycena citricolor]|uniref:F-box domain-containing protein n=1 Tax=Mycena citricolor TaxID=2018698 RepID=A0AAD2K5P2_9AGAR|nr:unnamed protein product [Mycena citricolor]
MPLTRPTILIALPVELLELILSHLPRRADLFSLAQTSRYLHCVIVPGHLYIREIQADLDDAVWTLLALRPYLAARVHRIDIRTAHRKRWGYTALLNEMYSISGTPQGSADKGTWLVKAIPNMHNLRRFSFDHTGTHANLNPNGLFQSLGIASSFLEKVELRIGGSFDASSLKTFILTVTSLPSLATTRSSVFAPIFDMLQSNPNLERLEIDCLAYGPRADLSTPLASLRLHHLRRVLLQGNLQITPQALCDFLAHHQGIEDLSLPATTDVLIPSILSLRPILLGSPPVCRYFSLSSPVSSTFGRKNLVRGGQNLTLRWRRLEQSVRGREAQESEMSRLSGLQEDAESTMGAVVGASPIGQGVDGYFRGFKVPEMPKAPESDECCMSGCAVCVYDLYDESMTTYRASVEVLRIQLADAHIPEIDWPSSVRLEQKRVNAVGGGAGDSRSAALSAFEQLEITLANKRKGQADEPTASAPSV